MTGNAFLHWAINNLEGVTDVYLTHPNGKQYAMSQAARAFAAHLLREVAAGAYAFRSQDGSVCDAVKADDLLRRAAELEGNDGSR